MQKKTVFRPRACVSTECGSAAAEGLPRPPDGRPWRPELIKKKEVTSGPESGRLVVTDKLSDTYIAKGLSAAHRGCDTGARPLDPPEQPEAPKVQLYILDSLGPVSTSWNGTGLVMASHLWQMLSKSDRKFMLAYGTPPSPPTRCSMPPTPPSSHARLQN